MKSKKYLAWIFSSQSLKELYSNNSFIIGKLCENFEKIYFINVHSLRSFSDHTNQKQEFSYALDKKFKVPSNIEIFNPKTTKDFKDFMIGKELIAINSFGRHFSEIKIHFLLAKYQIKQVQINNSGGVQQYFKPLHNFFWKNLIYKLNKNYSHKLIVLLSNFGLVPKIEIRFMSNSKNIEIVNKSFIKKILYNLKLFYAKEFVLVNSRSFDIFIKNKIEIFEDCIVLLDTQLDDPQLIALSGKFDRKNIEKHYYYLNKLINNFSNIYKKKVVVCLHPKDNLQLKKKYFPNIDVVQYETRENIYKAFLVLCFGSSAIVDAIFLKKRILSLSSNFAGKIMKEIGQNYADKAGLLQINIEDETKIDKDKFLSKLDDAKENYLNFIKSFLAPDGDNIGYEKIIKILKERFF